MKIEIPKSFYAIIPLKIALSIASTLIVILIITIGGGGPEVGIVMALTLLGNLLGNVGWAKFLAITRKYIMGYISGYFGIFLSLIILLNMDTISIFTSAFLLTFMSNLTYLSAMFLVSESYPENLNDMIGKFEMIGGWAWVSGLAVGAFIVDIVSPDLLIISLSILSFTSIILTSFLLGANILNRFIQGIKKDFGLLPLIDKGLERVLEYEEVIPDIILKGIHVIFSGSIMYFPVYIKIKLPTREKTMYYIALLTQFAAYGLVYSQLIKYIKDLGFSNSLVYIISMLSSIISALMYPLAGKAKKIGKTLITMNFIRVILFIILIIINYVPSYFIIILIGIFAIFDGITWAYIVILLNLIALKTSKEEVGISNFIRNIGSLIGSILSGIIIALYNFQFTFILAIFTLTVSTIVYIKVNIS